MSQDILALLSKFAANPDLLPQFQAFLEAQGAAKSSVPESGPPAGPSIPNAEETQGQPTTHNQCLTPCHLPGALSRITKTRKIHILPLPSILPFGILTTPTLALSLTIMLVLQLVLQLIIRLVLPLVIVLGLRLLIAPGLAVVIVVAPAPTPAPVLALALGPVLALALVSGLLLTIAPPPAPALERALIITPATSLPLRPRSQGAGAKQIITIKCQHLIRKEAGAKVIKATFLKRMSRQEAHKFIVKHGHPFRHKYNMYFNPYRYVPKDPKAVARIHQPPGECGVDWQLLYAMGCRGDHDLYNSTRGKIRAVAKAFACRIVEHRQLETITWGDFGSSNCKEFYDGCYKACPWLFHFRGEANDDCWVAQLVIQQYLVQAKGYDPKQTKPREQDNNLCRNASKLAHKDVIPPKDKDPYYINVPEGGYSNGPKRLAKFKRSDSPSCGQSLSTQLPPLTLSSNRHARRADKVVSEEEACATASKSSASTTKPAAQQGNKQKASVGEPAANANSPPLASPPSLDSPRDRPSPSPPQDSPPSLSPPPPRQAPVKPMEPCRKEPSKPAANPKETRQLKRKAKNNRDEPATKRQQPSRVVEPAVDKEAGEQGPSKQKIRPRMRPKRDPTPKPEPKSQLPPPPPLPPNPPQQPQPQPQPQPKGGKEHPDGGDGASSTKPSAPKPRESTPAPDSPPTPKQTKRGQSRNIPNEESQVVKPSLLLFQASSDNEDRFGGPLWGEHVQALRAGKVLGEALQRGVLLEHTCVLPEALGQEKQAMQVKCIRMSLVCALANSTTQRNLIFLQPTPTNILEYKATNKPRRSQRKRRPSACRLESDEYKASAWPSTPPALQREFDSQPQSRSKTKERKSGKQGNRPGLIIQPTADPGPTSNKGLQGSTSGEGSDVGNAHMASADAGKAAPSTISRAEAVQSASRILGIDVSRYSASTLQKIIALGETICQETGPVPMGIEREDPPPLEQSAGPVGLESQQEPFAKGIDHDAKTVQAPSKQPTTRPGQSILDPPNDDTNTESKPNADHLRPERSVSQHVVPPLCASSHSSQHATPAFQRTIHTSRPHLSRRASSLLGSNIEPKEETVRSLKRQQTTFAPIARRLPACSLFPACPSILPHPCTQYQPRQSAPQPTSPPTRHCASPSPTPQGPGLPLQDPPTTSNIGALLAWAARVAKQASNSRCMNEAGRTDTYRQLATVLGDLQRSHQVPSEAGSSLHSQQAGAAKNNAATLEAEAALIFGKQSSCKRATLRDYPSLISHIAALSIPELVATAITKGAYGTHEILAGMTAKVYTGQWARKLPNLRLQKPPASLVSLLVHRISWARCQAKVRICPHIPSNYGFINPPRDPEDVKYNQKLAKALLPNAFHCCDLKTDIHPYEHPALSYCIAAAFFWAANSVGMVFHKLFYPVPIPTVAMALTRIQHGISEWITGQYVSKSLNLEKQRKIYKAHLAGLTNFGKDDPDWLHNMQINWFWYAVDYAGGSLEDKEPVQPVTWANQASTDGSDCEADNKSGDWYND
ncbi:LON domain serine protease [Rhizoctonia solani]|uniref:LON domain serine protease n=1 Tax=Rhizoctonia solani TaxID=456999 RepID=A0A8H8NQV8_9AGAM|nr:LON domain serine protease [Rhizoctonia solani]QRW16637.1 LON domain serine protease [Rhizoctonia solani]